VTPWQTLIYFVYTLSLNYHFSKSNRRLPTGFIFQQNDVPAHTARSTQNWLRANYPDFITKDQWPLNSPKTNPVDYCVWCAMLEAYLKLKTKPKTIAELKESLRVIWSNLPQGPIKRLWKTSQIKRLKASSFIIIIIQSLIKTDKTLLHNKNEWSSMKQYE